MKTYPYGIAPTPAPTHIGIYPYENLLPPDLLKFVLFGKRAFGLRLKGLLVRFVTGCGYWKIYESRVLN